MNETNTTSSIIQIVNSGFQELYHSPVWLLVAIVGFVVAATIRQVKCVSNRFIPLFVLPISAIVFGRLANPSDVPYTVPHPRIVLGLYGFIEGFVLLLLFPLIISQLEKRLPFLKPQLVQFESAPPFPLPDGSNIKPEPPAETKP